LQAALDEVTPCNCLQLINRPLLCLELLTGERHGLAGHIWCRLEGQCVCVCVCLCVCMHGWWTDGVQNLV